MEENRKIRELICERCGEEGAIEGDDDGFFYCGLCSSRYEGMMDTGVADEDFVNKTGRGALYLQAHRRKRTDEPYDDFTEPADFGSASSLGLVPASPYDYWTVLRRRYMMGLQMMLQLQCQTLVTTFHLNPLVCGIATKLWLGFLASTRVFASAWPDEVLAQSETTDRKDQEETKKYKAKKYMAGEPRNINNERMVLVWFNSLKKTIPLSSTLMVLYLACHVVRAPTLPTDILRWTVEGKLPYLSAFTDIEKLMARLDKSLKFVEMFVQIPGKCMKKMMVSIEKASFACPFSTSCMFRPLKVISPQKLESGAASIAVSLGLNLPPVNFDGIASCYLKQLALPVEKILPYAHRVFEWSSPAELWLSANESSLPTRVCVMSMLIVVIRILYNLNGFGVWEDSLATQVRSSAPVQASSRHVEDDFRKGSTSDEESLPSAHKFEFEASELLRNLKNRYLELNNGYEFAKDLPTYLQHCRDVIFAGSSDGDEMEAEFIEKFWDFYQKNQEKTSGEEQAASPYDNSKAQENTPTAANVEDLLVKREIGELKMDMKEHQFVYIPPRKNIKIRDYLIYQRKRDEGSLIYAAHADYYILLRACAKVAQIDLRVMHTAVLKFERLLDQTEKTIDHILSGHIP